MVDAGRSRTTFFNEQTMISALRTVWYSKANGFQRRGRAGRCRPGVWYRLYTKLQWEAMDEYELPEMQRSPLEELCLEVPEAANDFMFFTYFHKAPRLLNNIVDVVVEHPVLYNIYAMK